MEIIRSMLQAVLTLTDSQFEKDSHYPGVAHRSTYLGYFLGLFQLTLHAQKLAQIIT